MIESERVVVSFEDCCRELLERAGLPAQRAYDAWRWKPSYESVVEFVTHFTHEYLFQITLEHLVDVMRRSEHALGDVRKEEQLREVEDFTTPFAYQHLFHHYLETERSLPTWQEFRSWLNGDAAAFFIRPLLERVGWEQADQGRRKALRRAFQWRLGKFYYSAMREIDLLVRLRSRYGLPLRYHLLADVLLRTDFWLGDTLVCTFFPNPTYRTATQGRKPPAEQFFREAVPPFRVIDIEIERQGFGSFWVVTDEALERVVRAIEA